MGRCLRALFCCQCSNKRDYKTPKHTLLKADADVTPVVTPVQVEPRLHQNLQQAEIHNDPASAQRSKDTTQQPESASNRGNDDEQLLKKNQRIILERTNNNCDQPLTVKQIKLKNEIEQSLAASISDRATDEVLEALTRYRRGLGIADSPSVLDEPQTPDIVRSRSSHDTEGMIIRPGGRGSILPKLGLESPTKLEYLNLATPHMPTKRRSIARKVRPQSVVENLSLGHIPDLLESPSSHRNASHASPHDTNTNGGSIVGISSDLASVGNADDFGVDECCDSITELPSASFQLQHLVKGRPKRAKTRAPTRPLVDNVPAAKEIGEGLEQFFRPGSVTPTTLTPLVSPTSDECSSLSFVDSPTMSRDGNGHMTSEETTPILEERKPIKLERNSPLLKGASWTTRSRSTDNLEKYSPLVGRKSPLVKMRTEGGTPDDNEQLLKAPEREGKMRSPSSDSIKSHATATGDNSVIIKTGNGILRTPIVLQKPRPWSVVGSEPKTGNGTSGDGSATGDSSKTTPEKLDDDCDVMSFSQGGSIVGITPGMAAAVGSGGGSIVGITPGAALEKKSVRELAAGLNRMDLPMKPQPLPRSLLTSSYRANKDERETSIGSTKDTTILNANSSQTISSATKTVTISNEGSTAMTASTSATTSAATTTTTSVLSKETTKTKIISTISSINSETNETLTKTIITENGSNSSSTQSNHSTTKNNNNLINNNNIVKNISNGFNNNNRSSSISQRSSYGNEIINIRNSNASKKEASSVAMSTAAAAAVAGATVASVSTAGGTTTSMTTTTTTTGKSSANFLIHEKGQQPSTGSGSGGFKRIAGKEISAVFEEKLVEGLQRSSVRRTFRDAQYTKEDVVDV